MEEYSSYCLFLIGATLKETVHLISIRHSDDQFGVTDHESVLLFAQIILVLSQSPCLYLNFCVPPLYWGGGPLYWGGGPLYSGGAGPFTGRAGPFTPGAGPFTPRATSFTPRAASRYWSRGRDCTVYIHVTPL